MKNLAWMVVVVALTLVVKTSQAQDRGFGVGAVVGETSGVTGKYWLGDKSALDFNFGFSAGGDRLSYKGRSNWSRMHLHADYLYHFFDVVDRAGGRLPFYAGAGPRINFAGGYDVSFGLRGVGGAAWLFKRLPMDAFIEAAPVLQFGHDTGFGIEGGIGARYYF